MFASLLRNDAADRREAVVTASATTTWGELGGLARVFASRWPSLAGRRVGLVFRPDAGGLAALAAFHELSSDVFLFDAGLGPDEARALARELRLGALVAPSASTASTCVVEELAGEAPGSGERTVTILTSGSTGRPKAVRHTWQSLLRPVRVAGGAEPPRWLLSYRPHLYAGLQVILQCVEDHGCLVVPEADAQPGAVAHLMRDARVGFASATASYWRRLVLFAPAAVLREVPLVQITLGGEVVDQQILDGLRARFPRARIVHIYATTELGRCFAVSDGRAGFPVSLLGGATPEQSELRIEGGELWVRSKNAMRSYDPHVPAPPVEADWFRTGDMVEVVGDRVYFVSRRSDIINVGGNKVHPIEVERVIRQVPGVSDVRVYGKRSSIAGELVACEIVASAGRDAEEVRSAVASRCSAELASFQRPRLIRFVGEIALERSGKTLRSGAPRATEES